VLRALEKYSELIQDDKDTKAFSLSYKKMCSLLARETLLDRDNYLFKDFILVFGQMIETYCPSHLYETLMEEEKQEIEYSCYNDFAVVVDENTMTSNKYMPERAFIKYFD
jgi:hypothetical protein